MRSCLGLTKKTSMPASSRGRTMLSERGCEAPTMATERGLIMRLRLSFTPALSDSLMVSKSSHSRSGRSGRVKPRPDQSRVLCVGMVGWLIRVLRVVELSGPEGVRVESVIEPPGDGDVLIDVHAIGIGYSTLLRSLGTYQERS